ncbi:unnamed protein product [Moneuplotes crassus]|uniref:Uncharacterized protein n=1 Tax=Euplotes crassus TaxID=5936 RepID=A0AAD2D5N0_EUPCR|nr:unnamed protein product [Moneuplotes crassus]
MDYHNVSLQSFHDPRFGGDYLVLLVRIFCMIFPMVYCEYASIGMAASFFLRTYYLTSISKIMVTIISFFGAIISLCKINNIGVSQTSLEIYQLMYEAAFVSQVIVFTVYWVAIHNSLEERAKEQPAGYAHSQVCNHLLPFVAISCDMLVTRPVFSLEHQLAFFIMGTLYTLNNFAQTKLFGWSPYPFLKWEDWTSIGLYLVGCPALLILYTVIALITNVVNSKEIEDFELISFQYFSFL